MKLFPTVALWATVYGVDAATTISVPTSLPTNASPPVQKRFLGLALESWNFVNFTGTSSSPNKFSLNLISALTDRVDLPIRVGGTSGDRVIYDPSQTVPIQFPSGTDAPPSVYTRTIYGPSYFDGFSLAKGVKWIFQVPLDRNNLTNAVTYVQDAIKAMPSGSFQTLEIGNEPQQYGGYAPTGYGSWGPAAYAKAFKNFTDGITAQVTSLPKNQANYWALSSVWQPPSAWSLQNDFSEGLQDDIPVIQAVSQHYYQADAKNGYSILQNSLLNHSGTVATMQYIANQVMYLKNETNSTVPLVLGEVASSDCTGSCTTSVQASFGAAIWVVDFMLHAMTIGVQRVNMEGTDHTLNSPWQPVPYKQSDGSIKQPEVHGTFYGELVIADLIKQTAGELRVAELPVSSGGGSVVAYGAYDSGKLNKVMLLNEQVYLTTSTTPRSTSNVTLNGLTGVKSVQLRHLSGSAADQYSNITWAGQQWTYANNGMAKNVSSDNTSLAVTGGSVTIQIEASQVIMVSLSS